MLAGLLLALVVLIVPDSLSAQKKKRGDRMRITQDELVEAAANVNTAADVIRTLRPQWLNAARGLGTQLDGSGGGGGATEAVLYIDDIRQPSLNELQSVKASSIVEMRFLDQNRAISDAWPRARSWRDRDHDGQQTTIAHADTRRRRGCEGTATACGPAASR